jgi:hypothetical protein
MLAIEMEHKDAMLVFVSDVWLDSNRVLSGLKHMLEGFVQSKLYPTAFVFMGPFCSEAYLHSNERITKYQSKHLLNYDRCGKHM